MSWQWQKLYFPGHEQLKLCALFHRPDNAIRARGAIVVSHGFTGSKEGGGRAQAMAEYLARDKWAVFLYDFAGNGESEGSFDDITLSGQIADLTAAISYCQQSGFKYLVSLGRSFGGTTAICQAANDKRVAAVCTWAAPVKVYELFAGLTDDDVTAGEEREKVMLAGAEGVVTVKRRFFFDLQKYDVPTCAASLAPRPLLVIHGTNDTVVPPAEAELLKKAYPRASLYYLNGADHQFSQHYPQVWEIVKEWLNKHVAGTF